MVSADTEPISVQSRRRWFEEHDPARRPLWVAEEDAEIVGWLSLGDFFDGRPTYHATAEVGVYVKESYRGRGIGGRLLAQAIVHAPGLGISTFTAGIFAHNEPSLELFAAFGFERWAFYPRVAQLDGIERDLVVLGLRLDEKKG